MYTVGSTSGLWLASVCLGVWVKSSVGCAGGCSKCKPYALRPRMGSAESCYSFYKEMETLNVPKAERLTRTQRTADRQPDGDSSGLFCLAVIAGVVKYTHRRRYTIDHHTLQYAGIG